MSVQQPGSYVACVPSAAETWEVIAFGPFQGNTHAFSLRKLQKTDLGDLYRWLSEQYPGLGPVNDDPSFEEAYSCISDSDTARTFIGMIDDSAVCEIEIHLARHHPISLACKVRAGDYMLHVQTATAVVPDLTGELVHHCVEYFLGSPEAGRILAEADQDNESLNKLLKDAGFRWQQKVKLPYKTSNLYACTSSDLAGS